MIMQGPRIYCLNRLRKFEKTHNHYHIKGWGAPLNFPVVLKENNGKYNKQAPFLPCQLVFINICPWGENTV